MIKIFSESYVNTNGDIRWKRIIVNQKYGIYSEIIWSIFLFIAVSAGYMNLYGAV